LAGKSNQQVEEDKKFCLWYDQCHQSGSHSLNCVANIPAPPLYDEEALAILERRCPEYYSGSEIFVKILLLFK